VFDLLDEELHHALLLEPGRFASELRTFLPGTWVIVDEVQRIPSLLNEVHRFLILATWVLWRTIGKDVAEAAFRYVAPVGEEAEYISYVLATVESYLAFDLSSH
jgi:hypothetical protein